MQVAEFKQEQDQILRKGQQALRETLFARHPYRLNILGKPETVAKLTRADLVDFHRRYVVPNNMVLAAFGNVKADVVLEKVQAKFGGMKSVSLEFPPTSPERLTADARKIEKVPKQQAVLLIGYSGVDIFSKDRFAMELLNEAYSGLGSRVFQRIRDELGLCYYVGASQLIGLEPGYFAFYVGTNPQNVGRCEKEIFAEVDRLKANGLSEEELARAKNSLIGQRRVRMQDNSELGMMVGLDELTGLGYDYFKTVDDKYQAVTLEDIKRVANQYFNGTRHAVVVETPSEEKE